MGGHVNAHAFSLPIPLGNVQQVQRLLKKETHGKRGSGSERDDHEFPFLRDVELVECSLTILSLIRVH